MHYYSQLRERKKKKEKEKENNQVFYSWVRISLAASLNIGEIEIPVQ